MNLINDLVTHAQKLATDEPVKDLLVGLHWTVVTTRQTGLASTATYGPCCYDRDMQGVGRLHERSARQLVEMLVSQHPLEVSVGMAALNSLVKVSEDDGIDTNARELLLQHSQGRRVAIIGHFPFTELLRKVAADCAVLELNPGPGELPAEVAPDILPRADVIGLTATTITNGSFDDLRKLFPARALVVMIGPTTPLCKVLFDHGVDLLAGSLVTDAATVWRYVGQGTTLHGVPGIRRFTIARDKSIFQIPG